MGDICQVDRIELARMEAQLKTLEAIAELGSDEFQSNAGLRRTQIAIIQNLRSTISGNLQLMAADYGSVPLGNRRFDSPVDSDSGSIPSLGLDSSLDPDWTMTMVDAPPPLRELLDPPCPRCKRDNKTCEKQKKLTRKACTRCFKKHYRCFPLEGDDECHVGSSPPPLKAVENTRSRKRRRSDDSDSESNSPPKSTPNMYQPRQFYRNPSSDEYSDGPVDLQLVRSIRRAMSPLIQDVVVAMKSLEKSIEMSVRRAGLETPVGPFGQARPQQFSASITTNNYPQPLQ
ncbi:hypothetical protein FRC18_001233 [Serendipita sp. 400]|nr:hypothetical protein FRC18_001233 [Serendipita sp. 400]